LAILIKKGRFGALFFQVRISVSQNVTNAELIRLHAAAQSAMNEQRYEVAHGHLQKILRFDPAFPDAYFLLGMIAFSHRQIRKALPLINHACELSPDNAEYLSHKAQCLALLKRDADAVAAAKRALKLHPKTALTFDTLGVSLVKSGEFAVAKTAFEKAVELQPVNAQFRFNLASCLQFLGELRDARREYEAAIDIRPDFYRAYWAVSALRTASPDDNRLDVLRHANTNILSADEQLYVGHAIAKELEDLDQFPESLLALHDAKAAKKNSINYSFAEDEEIFDALLEVCDDKFLASKDGCGGDQAIFVVGMPRTGTTLVERMISSHPDVYAAGELNDFGLLLKAATETRSAKVLDATTVSESAKISYDQLGARYIESGLLRAGNKPVFVDKMPLNVLYAGHIKRALPNAKIVCLRRNAIDTCVSNYRQLFSTDFSYYNYGYDLIDTARYYLQFDRLVSHWREHLQDCFLEVNYEDAVDDTEAVTRKLVEFCGLQWSDQVLNFEDNTAPVATASAAQVRSPVYKTSVDRWKRYGDALDPLFEYLESHHALK
jgi:tetratricopeptide (TPR) repeat protein